MSGSGLALSLELIRNPTPRNPSAAPSRGVVSTLRVRFLFLGCESDLGIMDQHAARKKFGTPRNITADPTLLWTSSDPTVATVSNDSGSRGRVTAVGPGTAQIDVTPLPSAPSVTRPFPSHPATLTVTP
jgi:hypothetical protein